jgi:hypothetical protein
LCEQSYAFGSGITIASYDVTHDGPRVVMGKDESTAGADAQLTIGGPVEAATIYLTNHLD